MHGQKSLKRRSLAPIGSRGAQGVRLSPDDDARVRAKIQTHLIVNRLTSFVEGEAERETIRYTGSREKRTSFIAYVPVMTKDQIDAARILLAKTIPDLTSTKIEGTVEHTVKDEARAALTLIESELARIREREAKTIDLQPINP